MNRSNNSCRRLVKILRGLAVMAFLTCLLGGAQTIRAAGWRNLEPLKSRRADVERELGQPVQAQTGAGNSLNFKVTGGLVTVTFVDAKFVQTKKLSPGLEGTVLLIVLQHENSSDTPESLNLAKKAASPAKRKMASPSTTTGRTASLIPSSTGDSRPPATRPPPNNSFARKKDKSK
jgi:hypothetical protein